MDQKILSYTLLVAISLIVLAFVYVGIRLPYGNTVHETNLNITIMQTLLIPFSGVMGALLRGKTSNENK